MSNQNMPYVSKWIKYLNKMYEENCCTCNGRVVLDFCPNMKVVVVKVFKKYEVIEIDDYTDWGLTNKIQDVVREMYETV